MGGTWILQRGGDGSIVNRISTSSSRSRVGVVMRGTIASSTATRECGGSCSSSRRDVTTRPARGLGGRSGFSRRI